MPETFRTFASMTTNVVIAHYDYKSSHTIDFVVVGSPRGEGRCPLQPAGK